MFGYSSSEALELSVEALVPEHLKAQHQAGMARYAETGHGLYISQRIMQAHGSELTLDSAPGASSVFGFELEAAR